MELEIKVTKVKAVVKSKVIIGLQSVAHNSIELSYFLSTEGRCKTGSFSYPTWYITFYTVGIEGKMEEDAANAANIRKADAGTPLRFGSSPEPESLQWSHGWTHPLW